MSSDHGSDHPSQFERTNPITPPRDDTRLLPVQKLPHEQLQTASFPRRGDVGSVPVQEHFDSPLDSLLWTNSSAIAKDHQPPCALRHAVEQAGSLAPGPAPTHVSDFQGSYRMNCDGSPFRNAEAASQHAPFGSRQLNSTNQRVNARPTNHQSAESVDSQPGCVTQHTRPLPRIDSGAIVKQGHLQSTRKRTIPGSHPEFQIKPDDAHRLPLREMVNCPSF